MFNGLLHAVAVSGLGAGAVLLHWIPGVIQALTPRCGLQVLTGWNCPFCGMTRDFAAMAAGAAPTHNPFSAVLALLLFGIYPMAVAVCLVRRRDFPVGPEVLGRMVPPVLAVMFIANNWGR